MFQLQSDLWLGDEATLRQMVALEARALAMSGTPAVTRDGGEKLPRLYSRHGDIGVITIRGGLINAEDRYTEYFNISTYPAIREALAFAADDSQVSKILLDIDSPGGMVSGVNDAASLVRDVRTVKPVTAYADNLIASAAYWIGSAADKLYVGQTAIVGSIGVIATIVSIHDALKKDGVDVRVIRSGKNKALGHPAEPMSDKAVKQVQERADAIYGVFTSTVTKNRPKLTAAAEDTWAQGNEFLGQDAVDAKLADGVSTFDRVVAQLAVDKRNSLNNTALTKIRGSEVSKPRAVLNEKIVAAIATGAQLTAEQQAEFDAAKAADAAAVAAEVAAAAAAEVAAQAATEAAAAAAATEAATAAATAAAVTAKKDELVAYLEGKLEASQAALAVATAEATAAKAEVATMKAPHDELVAIARDSVNKLTIALGGSEQDLSALPAKDLVARHASTAEAFKKKYPVGGVAVIASEDKTQAQPKKTATVTSLDASTRERSRIYPVEKQ